MNMKILTRLYGFIGFFLSLYLLSIPMIIIAIIFGEEKTKFYDKIANYFFEKTIS